MNWIDFGGGSTVGQRGSENGITIKDEEHSRGARITLERDTQIAPFAITCGIYGWLVHTRFFREDDDASAEYDRMKEAISGILARIPDATETVTEGDQMSRICSEIEDFVKMYP